MREKIFNTILFLFIPQKGIKKRERLMSDIESFINTNWELLQIGAIQLKYEVKTSYTGRIWISIPNGLKIIKGGGFEIPQERRILSTGGLNLLVRELNILLSAAREDIRRSIKIKIEEE